MTVRDDATGHDAPYSSSGGGGGSVASVNGQTGAVVLGAADVGGLPGLSGEGSPEGAVTAPVGTLYQDATNGALYEKVYGSDATGWVTVGGNGSEAVAGVRADGGNSAVAAGPGSGNTAALTDVDALAGSGNGVFWQTGAADGDQEVKVYVGPDGAHLLKLDAAGVLTLDDVAVAKITDLPAAGLPLADPAGVVIDTATYDNTITGSGKLTTVVFPGNTTAFAWAIAGDAFPRVIIGGDPEDTCLAVGDGTFDPYAEGGIISHGGGGALKFSGPVAIRCFTDMNFFNGTGVVLISPDSTKYRLKVADDGTLSTVDIALIFADDFNRANGALGSPWTAQVGGGFEVAANEAGCPDTNARTSTVDAGVDDYTAAVDVPTVSSGVALVVRYTDANNYVRLLMTGQVQEVVAGVATTLGTLSGGFVTGGDRIGLTVSGADVSATRNGVEEMTGTLATLLTGQDCGLLSIGDDISRFDDFAVRSL